MKIKDITPKISRIYQLELNETELQDIITALKFMGMGSQIYLMKDIQEFIKNEQKA